MWNALVAGQPAYSWIKVFYNCYEYVFDGGSTTKGKKTYRTGFYRRAELPGKGGIMEQYQIVISILNVIRNEMGIL